MASVGLLSAGCGLANDAQTAITGPLLALKDSDTVVEQNLQTVQTVVQSGEPASTSSIATTSGPSTGYGEISVSQAAGQPTVIAGFNQLSDDCLGLVFITTGGAAVLGQSQPGSYYFWVTGTTSAACDAASFAATPAAPSAWGAGDPSGSGWPLP
jgi:nitrous oxide reductase